MVVLDVLGFTDLPTGKLSGAKTVRWVKDYLLESFVKRQSPDSRHPLNEYRKILASDTSVVWCGQARCKGCVELQILCVQEPNGSYCAISEEQSAYGGGCVETTVRTTFGGWEHQSIYPAEIRESGAELKKLRQEAVEINPPRFDQSRAKLQIRQAWAVYSTTKLCHLYLGEGLASGLDELKTWGAKYNDVAGGGWHESGQLVDRVLLANARMDKLLKSEAQLRKEAAEERAKLEKKAKTEIEDLRKAVSNQVIESMKMRDNVGQRVGATAVESPVLAELRQTIYKELAELRQEAEALSETRLEAAVTAIELMQHRQTSIDQLTKHAQAIAVLEKENLDLRYNLDEKDSQLRKMRDALAVENGRDHKAVSENTKHDLAVQLAVEQQRTEELDRKAKMSLIRTARLKARMMDIDADLESRDEGVVEGLRKEVAGLRETLAKQSPGGDLAQQGTSRSIDEADLIRARRHTLKAALSLGVVTPRQVPDEEKEVESEPNKELKEPNDGMEVELDERHEVEPSEGLAVRRVEGAE